MNGWPKNADGTTDWDTVFDDPSNGLIPLVKKATTLDALRAIAGLVIEQLFTRKADGAYRSAYSSALDSIIPFDGLAEDKDFDAVSAEVAALLATIRDERKRKAAEYLRKKAEEEAKSEEERRDEPTEHPVEVPEPEPAPEPAPQVEEPVIEPDSVIAARMFAEAFVRYYQARLRAYQAGFAPNTFKGIKAPYILSNVFESHFMKVLNLHFLPTLIERCHGLMHRATETEAEKREAFFQDAFTNKKSRQEIWARWQMVWDDVLETKDIPPKPENDKEEKGGLLGSLTKITKKKSPSWQQDEMTLSEWKTLAKEIKADNRKAELAWSTLTEENESYDPPEEEDKVILKELFGRSPEAITKQRTAIRQIFEQGGSFAQGFDNYMRKTRSVDASMLALCYERPDLFFGKKAQLFSVMSGYDDSAKNTLFRLTWRYHGKRAEDERKKIA